MGATPPRERMQARSSMKPRVARSRADDHPSRAICGDSPPPTTVEEAPPDQFGSKCRSVRDVCGWFASPAPPVTLVPAFRAGLGTCGAQDARGSGLVGSGLWFTRGARRAATQACSAAFNSMPRPLRASTSTEPVSELRRKRSPGTPESSRAFTVRGASPITVSFVPAVR